VRPCWLPGPHTTWPPAATHTALCHIYQARPSPSRLQYQHSIINTRSNQQQYSEYNVTKYIRNHVVSLICISSFLLCHWCKILQWPVVRCRGNPYSSTECMVPELIPVLRSQPAGDVSHKPGGRLPLLSAKPAVTRQHSRGLLPISLLGEQRHNGCEQFA